MSSNNVTNNKASNHSEQSARRRMRKGTRSCLQCRSRKIRCIYQPNSSKCNSCLTHSRTCAEQTFADIRAGGLDKRVGLKERVKELENLVRQLVEKGGDEARSIENSNEYLRRFSRHSGVLSPPDSTSTSDKQVVDSQSPVGGLVEHDEETASDSYDSLEDVDSPHTTKSNFENAPFVSLFDNALLTHELASSGGKPTPVAPKTTPGKPHRSTKGRASKILDGLRALILPEQDLKIILNAITHLQPIWAGAIADYHLAAEGSSLEEALNELLRSNRPIHLCKAFACLSLLIQQRPTSKPEDELRLSDGAEAKDLLPRYLETVESILLNGENNLIGSMEGLECALILAKYFVNDGRPRRAWLLCQRSLSEARMLGLHRAASWRTYPDRAIAVRRERLWLALYQGDRYLSLILGLPHSVFDAHIGLDLTKFGGGEMLASGWRFIDQKSYLTQLAIIAGHIIDRNQNPDVSSALSYSNTMKIDGELHALSCAMPEKWWQFSKNSPNMDLFTEMSVHETYDVAMAQIWYHECRLALHLPFMSKNASDGQSQGRYSYSRQMALKSSRALITVHLHLRSRPELTSMMCQVIDYQAFTSTLLLLLDVIGRTGPFTTKEEVRANSDSELDRDQELIRSAVLMLQRLAKENRSRNNVPGQAVKVLQTLCAVFLGCDSPGIDRHTRRIVIPYFGAINIKPSTALDANGWRKENSDPQSQMENSGNNLQNTFGITPELSEKAASTTSVGDSVTFDSYVSPESLMTNGCRIPETPTNQTISAGKSSLPNASFSTLSINKNQDNFPMQDADAMSTQMGELDASIWNDGVWQNMLLQDPDVDLDADWNWFPVEGIPGLTPGKPASR